MPSTSDMIIPAMLLTILGIPQAIHQAVPNSYPGQTMPEQNVATAVGFALFSQIYVTSAFTSIVGACSTWISCCRLRSSYSHLY